MTDLRDLRRRAGATLTTAAAFGPVSIGTLSRVERGQRRISASKLAKIRAGLLSLIQKNESDVTLLRIGASVVLRALEESKHESDSPLPRTF